MVVKSRLLFIPRAGETPNSGRSRFIIIFSAIIIALIALGLYYAALVHFIAKFIILDGSAVGVENGFLLFTSAAVVSSLLCQVSCMLLL